jgi:hypothetical protein
LKQSNKKLERKLQATWLTAVGTYLPKTKGTNFSNALESATTFLYIVLRSQEVFKYHHHQQGVRHHEKFIGISIQVLVSNTEREREREKSLLFLQKLLEQLLHWEENALCDPCLHSSDECVCTGSRTAMLLKLCLQIQSAHIISKG